jgi:hypothetical protein
MRDRGWAATRSPTAPPQSAIASAPAAQMVPTNMMPNDEAAMDAMVVPKPVPWAERVVVIVPITSIPPSPATQVMPPARATMDLVDEVGVFDGVTQAVGATERDGSGGLGEQVGAYDRCGCNDESESPHGVLLIERADRPSHRTFD